MAETNKKRMDVYPWAVPTQEQKQMFDSLGYDEQLEMVRAAIIEGEESGYSSCTVDEIIKAAKE